MMLGFGNIYCKFDGPMDFAIVCNFKSALDASERERGMTKVQLFLNLYPDLHGDCVHLSKAKISKVILYRIRVIVIVNIMMWWGNFK